MNFKTTCQVLAILPGTAHCPVFPIPSPFHAQVIAVDADPRNLAYLKTSLDLNNSTHNVRILYNAVRYRCTDKATIRCKPCCYFDVSCHQQREHHPLPDDPRPQERGRRPHVHGAAPPGGKPQCDPVYSHDALILHLHRIINFSGNSPTS